MGITMANEDVIGITINGENVANFSIPSVGHAVKLNEYQFTNVGGVLEVSVAFVKDESKPVGKVNVEVVKAPLMEDKKPEVAVPPSDIVPVAKPTRKPRTPKVAPITSGTALGSGGAASPSIVEDKSTQKAEPQTPPTVVNKNARVSEIAKMIKFYCKAAGKNVADMTIDILRADAPDIIENDDDATINAAMEEAKK